METWYFDTVGVFSHSKKTTSAISYWTHEIDLRVPPKKKNIYNSTMVAVGLVCFPMCTCDCWWKRSCTSWCVVYPIFYMVLAHPRWCMISSINRSTTNHNLSPGRFQSVSPLRASRDPFSWIQAKRCILGGIWGIEKMYPVTGNGYISHLGKRNIIFKSTLVTGYVSSFQGG